MRFTREIFKVVKYVRIKDKKIYQINKNVKLSLVANGGAKIKDDKFK